MHRDAVNPLLAALLPVARKVAEEDKIADPAVKRLLDAVRGWDLRAGDVGAVSRRGGAAERAHAVPRFGPERHYGAGMGGVTNLARRLAADFERTAPRPGASASGPICIRWLQASAQGGAGRTRRGAGDDWMARLRTGRRRRPGGRSRSRIRG